MRCAGVSGAGRASAVSLIEARPVKDPASRERLVRVHSVDARNDPGGLLIPFRLAAAAADLGLWSHHLHERPDWGRWRTVLASLVPACLDALGPGWSGRVHPDDRVALRRLVRSTAAQSPWISLRFRTENDGWDHIACQIRRIQPGHGGPEQVFG